MKKVLYVIMTCIFIMSFAVCGTVQTSAASKAKSTTGSTTKTEAKSTKNDTKKSNDEKDLYRKYEPLINLLEDGDYQGALKYVNQLHAEARKKMDEEANDAPLMDIVVGTYVDPENGFSVKFNPDYTIEYEDSTELLLVYELTNTLKKIDAKEEFLLSSTLDGTSYKTIDFTYNEDLHIYELGMSDHKGEWHNLIKEGLIETVELTNENWDDYFEITDHLVFSTDAFGDITSTGIRRRFVLKDGIKLYKGTGAVRFSLVRREYNVLSFDQESKTFELGDETSNSRSNGHDILEYTDELERHSNWNNNQEEYLYFGCPIDYYWDIDENNMTIQLPDEIEVDRIEGTLHILK